MSTTSFTNPAAVQALQSDPAFQLQLRMQIDRETDLLGQRTAWVMASQAFLFSAYAIAVNAHADPTAPKGGTRPQLLVNVIPWISLLSLLLLVVTIAGGLIALVRLRTLFLSCAEPKIRALDPGPIARVAGLAAPLFVPMIFLIAWVVLLAD